MGDDKLADTMIKDGLWDAFNNYHMGTTAENVAEKFQVTREEQDKFAFSSQKKTLKAQKENKFKDEIINFKIKSKNTEINFTKDEYPRDEKIKTIKTRIRKNCSPKHVPSLVIKVPEIPRTKSGKIVELAVRKVIHGETINNKEAIANPESLEFFENLPQLKL
jgi:hypothetical protein